MTELAGGSTSRARLLTKNALRSLGLYPAARRLNQYLQQYRYDRSTAIALRNRQIARYKNRCSFFRPLITANDLVFDIGAHTGHWTQVFLDLGATVVACEPQSDCLRKLRARQTARATRGRLTVIDCAVGGARGRGRLYVREARGKSGLIEDWHVGDRIERVENVGIVTLDDLIDKHGVPRYCKIDVEGYEQEVLLGLTKPIPMISLEYHLVPEREIEKTVACLNYLANFGKLRVNITPAENLVLLFKQWVDYQYFVEFFTHHLKSLVGFGHHGDIFIRIE